MTSRDSGGSHVSSSMPHLTLKRWVRAALEFPAGVRRSLWTQTTFQTSPADPHLIKMPRPLAQRLPELLSYAA